MISLTGLLANGRLIGLGLILLVLAAGALYIRALRADLALADLQAADARRLQIETAAALSRLRADQTASQVALAAVEAARQKAETNADALRRRIAAAPRSRACVDSPAVRGLLNDLRAGAAGDRP
ncbi:hypothetical protein [Zavarzinia aquatilis]|uniref:Uncharacterized protein n=1 Tax=Zavarzinia aquatilis TaxID=2211142 RepID=A0A317EDD3_9PROT|nr:hypothetical protein [Zavarzinia aquatilis]PWR24592.1 hypothetical protein DKG74_07240 [Zavarzinia aquatilis]